MRRLLQQTLELMSFRLNLKLLTISPIAQKSEILQASKNGYLPLKILLYKAASTAVSVTKPLHIAHVL